MEKVRKKQDSSYSEPPGQTEQLMEKYSGVVYVIRRYKPYTH